MTVDIVGASRKNKEDFPVADNSKFETLSSYMQIAKRLIGYFAPKIRKGLSSEMLASDDAVSYVAEAIMMADWLFDENYIGKRTSTFAIWIRRANKNCITLTETSARSL